MDGLNGAARDAAVPFRCYALAPMSAMAFETETPEQGALIWTYFLQEAAQRGVLFRRGGLNSVAYTHTETDIDQAVTVARQVFQQLRRGQANGRLPAAVKADPSRTTNARAF